MLGNNTLNIHIFSSIDQIRKNNRTDLVTIIHKQLEKHLKNLTNDSLSDRMKSLINRKLINKNNRNAVFYYVNQEIIYRSIVGLISEMITPASIPGCFIDINQQ